VNNIDLLKVSLNNLIDEANKFYNSSYDSRTVKTFFEIVTGIEKFITQHFFNVEELNEFKKELPKYNHLDFNLITKSFLERISEYPLIGSRHSAPLNEQKEYNETMGFTYRNKKREATRTEVSKIIIQIDSMAKETLKKIISSNNGL